MRKIIKFQAEIDMTKKPAECRVKKIDDIWMDFGYALEITGFLLHQAAGYKEETIDNMVAYAANYLKKAAEDYKIKP